MFVFPYIYTYQKRPERVRQHSPGLTTTQPVRRSSMATHKVLCSVEGCNRKHHGRGYCKAHLKRVKRNGDPGGPIIFKRGSSKRERFENYVDRSAGPDACHLWRGPVNGDYGFVCINYKQHSAHHLAYELHKGTVPKGKLLRHTCDNPLCVNPRHLIPGTQADNVADRVKRNRSARGKRNGAVKASQFFPDDIRRIRRRYESGACTQAELANEYGVSQQTISRICLRETWRWVEDA